MLPGVKAKDVELWKEWKRTGSPAALQALLNQMSPIINREVNKWQASMSRSLLEAEGKRLAVEAFKTYDPVHGAAISTYIASRLPKLSRMVYSTQNVARISEAKQPFFRAYSTAMNTLSDDLGREPTNTELQDHLGWSKKKLTQFQRQANRKEFIESEEHPDNDSADDHMAELIYHDFTPLQKSIFEYRAGYMGKPKLSNTAICKRLNITQGQLSYQISMMAEFAEKALKGHANG